MYFKKRMKRILLSLIMGFSFWGLFAQNNTFKTVDVKEFAGFIAKNDVTLLDVRTPAEHAEGYIPGTDFNIDVLEANFTEVALEKIPKDKPVALYCRSGNRSKTAARILSEKGYEVIELGKGFRAWEAAGKKIAYPKKK
jgi:rhodanese-related sulfurtransferase